MWFQLDVLAKKKYMKKVCICMHNNQCCQIRDCVAQLCNLGEGQKVLKGHFQFYLRFLDGSAHSNNGGNQWQSWIGRFLELDWMTWPVIFLATLTITRHFQGYRPVLLSKMSSIIRILWVMLTRCRDDIMTMEPTATIKKKIQWLTQDFCDCVYLSLLIKFYFESILLNQAT